MRPISAEEIGVNHTKLWKFQKVLHTLAATQEVPRHTRLHSRGARKSRPHPEEPRFRLLAREEGSFPAWSEKNSRLPVTSQVEALSTGKARRTPGSCHIPRVPQMSQSIPGKPVFPALPRLSSQGSTHTTVAYGTALCESLVGKPRGNTTAPFFHAKGSVTLLLQLGKKVHLHFPLERRTDSPGETPKYPKIHVSTGEETSGSGTDSTQVVRPRH